MRHVLRAGLAGALALGLLAGCASGPSQLRAAAIVGDRTIPIEQVRHQLRAVLDKEGEQAKAQLVAGDQLDDVSRQIVTLAIRHELLVVAAQREGLSVDEQRVTDLIDQLGGAEAATAGTTFTVENFRSRVRDQLLARELARTYLPKLSVTVDYTTVDTRSDAKRWVAELAGAGPQRARALIRSEVERGAAAALDQKIVAAQNPGFASAPVFGVGEDTVVAFPSDQRPGTWLVMVVTARSTAGASGQPPRQAEIAALEPALLAAAGIRQLGPVAQDLGGVRLNPRYGVWDPVSLEAAPNENETTGFIAPVREVPAA